MKARSGLPVPLPAKKVAKSGPRNLSRFPSTMCFNCVPVRLVVVW